MSRSLRNELRRAFGVLLFTIALIGAGGIVATTVTSTYVEEATKTVGPAIQANDALLQSMTDIETGLRGYVLSARRDALQPYREGLQRLSTQRARLRDLLGEEPQLRRLAAHQDAAVDRWLRGYAVPRVEEPVGPGAFDPTRFARAKRLFDDFRATNAALSERLDARLRALRADADNLRAFTTATVVALTLCGLAVGVLTTRSASRRVRRPLADLRDVLMSLIAGDSDARAEPHGPGEVVTIARSVNALADETDRLRAIEAEERRLQQRLLDFGREVRSILDPDEVVRRALAELGESLRLGRAYVRLVVDGTLQDITHEWCAPGVPALSNVASPGSMSLLRAIHRRRSPLASTDVCEDPLYDTSRGRQWAERTGARAAMSLSIPLDQEPVGVITCIDFSPREWTDAEIRLAEAVAADLARALEHARLYTAQAQAVRRLEDLDRAKDEFLSSVSHELRTPLTSINGYVELLEDDDATPVPEHRRQMLAVIRRNVDRLSVLIEDLLTLSRIESGAFRSTFQTQNLSQLIRTSVEDMRPQATQAGVDIGVTLPAGDVFIDGDPGQLARALLNVLGNAIKFSRAGGSVEVELRQEPGTDTAVVEVRDSGIGIPAADLDRVTTRFFRARNAVAAEVPGTGLGLVMVRTIVDNHGGSLELSSREHRGTTVRIALPTAPGRVPVDGQRADRAAAARPEP